VATWDGTTESLYTQVLAIPVMPFISVPTDVQAELNGNQITITWSAPTDNTVPVERYAIFWSYDDFETGFAISSTTTSATITVPDGVTVSIKVRADNDSEVVFSDFSQPAIVVVPPAAGPIPTSEPSPSEPEPSPTPEEPETPNPTQTPLPTPTPSEPTPVEPIVPPTTPVVPEPEPSQTPEPEIPILPLPQEPTITTPPTIEPEVLPEETLPPVTEEPSPKPTPSEPEPTKEEILEHLMIAAKEDDPQLPKELLAIPLIGDIAGAVLDAFNALGNVGADMTPEVREQSEKVIIASVIVSQIAIGASSISTSMNRKIN
jgi:hypothetical protein